MEMSLRCCLTCARPFSDRATWRAREISAEVRYCSAGCRRNKPTQRDRALEQKVMSALEASIHIEFKVLEEELALQEASDKRRLERAIKRLALRGELQIKREGRVEAEPGNARKPFSISLPPPSGQGAY